MKILIKFIMLYMYSLLVINTEATEDNNFGPTHSSSLSSGRELVSFESQPSFHTLLDCIHVSSGDYEKCGPQLIDFVSTLTLSPKARILLDVIKSQHGFINLSLVAETDTGALWTGQSIEIESRSVNNIPNFCQFFLIELCNAANKINGIVSPFLCENSDIYAFLTEAAEYFSVLTCNEIIKDYFSIRQLGDMDVDLLYEGESFMEYWAIANKKICGRTIHSDVYRNYYGKKFNICKSRLKGIKKYLVLLGGILELVKKSGVDVDYHEKQFNDCKKEFDFFPYGNLDSWKITNGNAEYLIAWAFCQKSFDLAKKETKFLKSSNGEHSLQNWQMLMYRPHVYFHNQF